MLYIRERLRNMIEKDRIQDAWDGPIKETTEVRTDGKMAISQVMQVIILPDQQTRDLIIIAVDIILAICWPLPPTGNKIKIVPHQTKFCS